jgi:SAM-dependent methyltransferase
MTDQAYDSQFYADISDGSRRSAAAVVPLVLRLFPGIRSVADFGCGSGTWLAEFSLCGVPRVTGLDFGDGTRELLFIPRESFRVVDLSKPIPDLPPHDLAMSLEVAEHLPEEGARGFVQSITSVSDLVLFSAAAPFQGGHNHFNERWPSYWIRLFQECGYRCHDVLRPLLWNDRRVEWWYRQNIMVFVKDGVVAPALDGLTSFRGYDLVHPDKLLSISSVPAPVAPPLPEEGLPDLTGRLAGPRPGLLATVLKGLRSTERALRRVVSALRGEKKATFKQKWQEILARRLIVRSGLFDGDWYAGKYGDVAASGLEPLEHFLTVGVKSRRDPGPRFSTERYLLRRPWLAQPGSNPLLHFLEEQVQRSRRG